MAIPLYVFVRGDTLGLVVLAGEGESVDELAQRLSRAAAPRGANSRSRSDDFDERRVVGGVPMP